MAYCGEEVRYRAVLVGLPSTEKPKQAFSNDLQQVRDWAKQTLAGLDKGLTPAPHIRILETKEELIGSFALNGDELVLNPIAYEFYCTVPPARP
jgi:hypothetical protein